VPEFTKKQQLMTPLVYYTNRASKVYYLPPSFRFPPLREGNRERRAYSVPPACRGNLKEGVLVYPYFCKLWLSDWYYTNRVGKVYENKRD
jgi:hypothetical protein